MQCSGCPLNCVHARFSAGRESQHHSRFREHGGIGTIVSVLPFCMPIPIMPDNCTSHHSAELLSAVEAHTAAGALFIHPFDDADLIAGHASVGLEIIEDVPEIHGVELNINLNEKIKKAYFVNLEKEIKIEDSKSIQIKVDKFQIHEALVLEY